MPADVTSSTPNPVVRTVVSRRAFLRNLGVGLAVPVSGAVYATQVELFWPQYHHVRMPVRNLPASFEGLRIAHLTDLHVSDTVPIDYVRGVVQQVNRLKPDIVFVTGDLVTKGSKGWIREACEVVASIQGPTYVSLGNHDYGQMVYEGRSIEVADEIQRRLTQAGCYVLRNAAVPLQKGGDRLWIMGLEDLWNGQFSPAQAFAGVDSAAPVLALSHNPDTAAVLDTYGAAWVFSGHTHGGQIRIPGYGAIMLPVQDRRLQQGLIELRNARLYISRGVGFLARARFCCRPEVPIFVATGV